MQEQLASMEPIPSLTQFDEELWPLGFAETRSLEVLIITNKTILGYFCYTYIVVL